MCFVLNLISSLIGLLCTYIIMFSSHVSKRAWCILVNQEFEWYIKRRPNYIIQCIIIMKLLANYIWYDIFLELIWERINIPDYPWLDYFCFCIFGSLVSLQTVIERASSKYIQCVLVAQMSFYVLLMLTVIMII